MNMKELVEFFKRIDENKFFIISKGKGKTCIHSINYLHNCDNPEKICDELNKCFLELKNKILNESNELESVHKHEQAKKVCCCINWHLPIEPNKGKRAICSYCKRPYQQTD